MDIQKLTNVERHFFRNERIRDPNWKHRQECERVAAAFTGARSGEGASSIELNGVSPRVEILADAASTGRATAGKGRNKYGFIPPTTPIFKMEFTTPSSSGPNYPYQWSKEEQVKRTSPNRSTSTVTLAQKVSPHGNHKGDCRVDFAHVPRDGSQPDYLGSHDVGSYSKIVEQLIELAPELSQQAKIAKLFLTLGDCKKDIPADQLKEKLEIVECTKDHLDKFYFLQDFLMQEAPFAAKGREILLHVANGNKFEEVFSKQNPTNDEEKDILGDFASRFLSLLEEPSPQKEKSLSSLLLQSIIPSKRSRPIKAEDLQQMGVDSDQKNVQFLNDLYQLLFIKEVSRRKNPDNPSLDLPYGLSLVRALKLASVAENRSNSLCRALSPRNGFLFFTKSYFLKGDDPVDAHLSIDELNERYRAVFPNEDLNSGREMGKTLVRYFGGGSDTDEEGYDRL